MIEVIKLPSTKNRDARVTLAPETTQSAVDRFMRLSDLFYGHRENGGLSWVFTEMRGRKCLALWQAGFDADTIHFEKSEARLIHPDFPTGKKGAKRFPISKAYDMAKLINAPKPAMQEVWA
jgi:hypothetical protein